MGMVSLDEYILLWIVGLVAVIGGVIAGIRALIRERKDRK